jgi:hypothetical protein
MENESEKRIAVHVPRCEEGTRKKMEREKTGFDEIVSSNPGGGRRGRSPFRKGRKKNWKRFPALA